MHIAMFINLPVNKETRNILLIILYTQAPSVCKSIPFLRVYFSWYLFQKYTEKLRLLT